MWHAEEEQNEIAPCQSSTKSEVVLMNEQSIATPTPPSTVENLNITKSKSNFVTVTQNYNNTPLQKTEVGKNEVRIVRLDLGSLDNTKHSIFAALHFAGFIAALALAMYIIFVFFKGSPLLDIDLNVPWYLRRDDWQAMVNDEIENLNLPVSHVIITHTGKRYCNDRHSCIAHIVNLQLDELRSGHDDIAPNFLVSGNGLVFEGRGANVMGSMVRYWNARSIFIAFMGNYMSDQVIQEQFDHINVLLDVLVTNGVLRKDYTLYAHCQVQSDTDSPGRNVIERLKEFVHWDSQRSGCH